MNDRSESIRLPADVARCYPSTVGQAASICARYKAALPQMATVADFSIEDGGCTALCKGFLSLSSVVKQPPTVGPRVFKSL